MGEGGWGEGEWGEGRGEMGEGERREGRWEEKCASPDASCCWLSDRAFGLAIAKKTNGDVMATARAACKETRL